MLEHFDPNTIQDEAVRQVVVYLMNLLEAQHAKIQEQVEESERLREENNRLKGEQGKPKIKANTPAPHLSSEKERRESKPHHKANKQATIRIDRVEVLKVDQHQLPHDIQFKGYEEVIVQDIDVRTENIKFCKENYSSPGQKRTYLAQLPAGDKGQFGPGVRAWVVALYYAAGMSEPKILERLHTVGLHISAGELSECFIHDQEQFHAQSANVLQAGLASRRWHHLDSTGTRVNGKNEHGPVLCNRFSTAYCTLPGKDRLRLLRVLQGGNELVFRCHELALTLLKQLGLAHSWCEKLTKQLPHEQDWKANELDPWLDSHLPKLGEKPRKLIKDALARAASRTQTAFPVVELLSGDDAPPCNWLTLELALCWIHEFRHSKKLMPCIPIHRHLLETFKDDFWKLYRELLDYRQRCSQQEADSLRREFDRLFEPTTGYEQLDKRKALTLAKKEPLLMVLAHPEMLLHNTPAELGARQRVRKRDVSLQARTKEGIGAWETFQTLVSTAKKLEVNRYQYVYDRLAQTNLIPQLATVIEERAKLFQFDASCSAVT